MPIRDMDATRALSPDDLPPGALTRAGAPPAGSGQPDAPAGTADARDGAAGSRSGTAGAPATAAAERRDAAVRAAVARGLVGPAAPVAALLDVTGIQHSAAALRAAFAEVTNAPVLHAFAVKASPLVPVLRLLRKAGIGAEVASPGELALARAAGLKPERTVLDSPAKTPAELRQALALGIAVNADNPQELARLDGLARSAPTRSTLGLRVNPQIGAGSIGALSTATATSKFGVGLRDTGAREWVVRAFLDRPWLTRLHTHSGSQGVPLELLAEGVRVTYELAEEINQLAGRRQIDTVDIGGGLPVNFASDAEDPTFSTYARLLRRTVPGLFDGRYALVTEFGRALLAKHGTIVARVEYTKAAGNRRIAITHAGAQVAARTVYAPASWPLRIAAYDARGLPKPGPEIAQDVAGPACFAGDLLAENRPLPLLEPGDHVAALDTGAYYFSHHYAYNSLARPGIHGFSTGRDGTPRFATIRSPQTVDELVAESGGEHARTLDGL